MLISGLGGFLEGLNGFLLCFSCVSAGIWSVLEFRSRLFRDCR